MIDIHCHILPEMDDGADSLHTSIKMCKIAYEQGIDTIIATPHYKTWNKQQINPDKILENIEKLNMEIELNNISITVLPGMEVLISYDIFELYQGGEILTLNNSRYMLIEFPNDFIPAYSEELFFKLMIIGIIPVIAHPERNTEVVNTPDVLSKFTEKGVLIQADAGSLTGIFGKTIQKVSRHLLKQNSIHFVATDAHTSHFRSPEIIEAYKYVKKINANLAEKIFNVNPFQLRNDNQI